jgi:hypothetical protein
MICSFLRESDSADGTPGPFSFRRIAAMFFALSCVPLFVLGIMAKSTQWFVFIPGALCVVAVLLLCFFTTWGDVAAIISAAKGGGPRQGGGP